jgi:hypothetical protein
MRLAINNLHPRGTRKARLWINDGPSHNHSWAASGGAVSWSKLMVRSKGITLLIAFVGLVGFVLWQQARITVLKEQITVLTRQAEQAALSHEMEDNDTVSQASHELRSNAPPSWLGEPSRELLRLRGDVGVLRTQLEESQERAATLRPSEEQINRAFAERHLRRVDEEVQHWQEHVAELASSLQVPEAVAKMDPEEGRHDESLKRYED